MTDIASSPVARFLCAAAPGIGLCTVVTLAAMAADRVQVQVFGRARLEALVMAIVIGTAVRTLWTPPARFQAGI